MNLFKKLPEKISISCTDLESLESLYEVIKIAKLKNITLTRLEKTSEGSRFCIKCEDAEVMYTTMLLPVIYDRANPDVFEIVVEFEDKSGKSKSYPKEALTSFRLDSGFPLGSREDQDFISRLKKAVASEGKAVVAYIIMSGGAVTISIPSAEPENTKSVLTDLFKSYSVTLFETNIISRERA